MIRPKVLVLGFINFSIYPLLGSLLYISHNNILRETRTYIGVSISAVYALLLACGYEALEIVNDSSVTKIVSNYTTNIQNSNLMNSISVFFNRSGIISVDPIRTYLTHKVKCKFGFVPTFKQLYDIRGMEFVSVTVNLTKKTTEYLSRDNNPNMNIVEACIMSMCFPLLVEKYVYNGDVYVDGSLGNPYPLDYMDDNETEILGVVADDIEYKDDMISYLISSLSFSMNELKRRIIENASGKSTTVILTNCQGSPEEIIMNSLIQTKNILKKENKV